MPLHPFPGQYGSHYNSVSRSNTAVATTSHTSSGTAHTYAASWQEVIASTPFDTAGIMVRLNTATGTSGVRSDCLVSVGVGAAGSEVPVIGPVAAGFKPVGWTLSLPLFIPAGSRIAVRHKSARTSLNLAYTIDLYGPPTRDTAGLPTRWVSYGIVDDASNSRGTAVTAGSTNAWGSWTALTTSTTYAHSLWVPIIDAGTASTSTGMNYRSQFAIAGTSGAADEVTNGTVWDGPMWATTTAEVMTNTLTITAGTWVIGGGFRPDGFIYSPQSDGASVSMRAMCSVAPDSPTTVAGSILAAVM